ncbi:MAG: aconitase subunit 1 [Chloroflexi bacterium]|nr:MAG: aconitase subunit 1 [Chloroflexota bacterium]
MLAGEQGPAVALALEVIVRMAPVAGAERLREITSAHIDGCLYHGQAGLDFAERLASLGGQVRVPTTLNVSSLDLLHPHLYRGDRETALAARRLMDAYTQMGCRPTWTCAPYQLSQRPAFGEQIAWAESNAIVFANSVLGARTNRYGDFLDICAALTARVPDAGLHQDAHRYGQVLYDLRGLPEHVRRHELLPAVLGHYIGHTTGNHIPVIVGLPPDTSEDSLKLLGAAAASSGSVALFHAVGVTPEAPTVAAAFGGRPPLREEPVTLAALNAARAELSTTSGGPLRTVSLGTPHASLAEIGQLVPLVAGQTIHPEVDFYVSTGRDVLAQAAERGWVEICEQAGVRFVVDTCTYITPILRHTTGVAMTNSPKWAYYAPGNLGVDVVFAGLAACVASALRGEVQRDADWA